MIRRPPRSTLFPYTRSSDLRRTHRGCVEENVCDPSVGAGAVVHLRVFCRSLPVVIFSSLIFRSEEHTSELQSRQYLVCRLLLEKKKKNISNLIMTSNSQSNV